MGSGGHIITGVVVVYRRPWCTGSAGSVGAGVLPDKDQAAGRLGEGAGSTNWSAVGVLVVCKHVGRVGHVTWTPHTARCPKCCAV